MRIHLLRVLVFVIAVPALAQATSSAQYQRTSADSTLVNLIVTIVLLGFTGLLITSQKSLSHRE